VVRNGVNMKIALVCKNKQNLVKMRNMHFFFKSCEMLN